MPMGQPQVTVISQQHQQPQAYQPRVYLTFCYTPFRNSLPEQLRQAREGAEKKPFSNFKRQNLENGKDTSKVTVNE